MYVELDDGGGADRSCEVDSPKVGEVIQAHGLSWRIVRVDTDNGYARAVVVSDLLTDRLPAG